MNIAEIPGIIKVVEKKPVVFCHGNNMDLLRYINNEMMMGYFHCGIVDPPYAISVGDMKLGATANSKPREYEMGQWDNELPTLEYWYLLSYACRNLIIWGGNYFTNTNVNIYEVCYDDGSKLYYQDVKKSKEESLIRKHGKIIDVNFSKGVKSGRCFYFWDKLNNGMSFADGELALTDYDCSARVIKKARVGNKDDDGDKRHPTQKPVYLYDYLHLQHDLRGKRVLDTHGGSFTHAIAAFKNNVHLTIIDREESYFNSGLEAYDNSTVLKKGQTLF